MEEETEPDGDHHEVVNILLGAGLVVAVPDGHPNVAGAGSTAQEADFVADYLVGVIEDD